MEIELARQLLNIPSVSGEEKEIAEFLVDRLSRTFKVETQNVGNNFNILATCGKPDIILTTHMDTVPGLLEIKEDNDYLYGRGACDTKGIIAAMVCACEEAVKEGFNNFGILLDVCEETDFSGINEAINLVNPVFVIIGEPTNLDIVYGQKGLLGVKLICNGKSAPGSSPKLGVSAINNLISNLTKINNLNLPEDDFLGKTTFNIGIIKGGNAVNIVPDYAEATIEFRTVTNNKELINLIKQNVGYSIVEILYNFEIVINNDLEFIKYLNLNKRTVSYFSEMYFWNNKSKTIVFGPGNYEVAHTNSEKISKNDITKGKLLYLEIIRKLYKSINLERSVTK